MRHGRCAEQEGCVNRFREIRDTAARRAAAEPLIASKSICTTPPPRSPAISDRDWNSEVRRKLCREVWGPSFQNVGVSLQRGPSEGPTLHRPDPSFLFTPRLAQRGSGRPWQNGATLKIYQPRAYLWGLGCHSHILRAISENPNCQQ